MTKDITVTRDRHGTASVTTPLLSDFHALSRRRQIVILFADEPTTNLDSVYGRQIVDLITALNRDNEQTVVMVTHEREYAFNCNLIIDLEDELITGIEYLR